MASIQPNQLFFIKGVIQYSSLSEKVTGDRLKQINENRKFKLPEHTSITLMNAEIMLPANRDKKTESEEELENKFYTTKKEPDVLHYQPISKVFNPEKYQLPWIAVLKPGTNTANQYKLKRHQELARGQKAIAVVRSFEGQGNTGLALNGVIVYSNNPNKPEIDDFGSTGSMRRALSDLGINLGTVIEQPEESPDKQANISEADLPNSMTVNTTANNATQGNQAPENFKTDDTDSDISAPWFDNLNNDSANE